VGVRVEVRVRVGVRVEVGVGDRVGVKVCVAVGDRVGEGVFVMVGVNEGVREGRHLWGVPVNVLEGVSVLELVGQGVLVRVGVRVTVGERVISAAWVSARLDDDPGAGARTKSMASCRRARSELRRGRNTGEATGPGNIQVFSWSLSG
jgi:hypothetical protein